MKYEKDRFVRKIGQDAHEKVRKLSVEFANAKSEDKEGILAEMEFNRFLDEAVQLCFDD